MQQQQTKRKTTDIVATADLCDRVNKRIKSVLKEEFSIETTRIGMKYTHDEGSIRFCAFEGYVIKGDGGGGGIDKRLWDISCQKYGLKPSDHNRKFGPGLCYTLVEIKPKNVKYPIIMLHKGKKMKTTVEWVQQQFDPSPPARPSTPFTAQRCSDIAERSATEDPPTSPSECFACKGKGKQYIRMIKLDPNESKDDDENDAMPCISCNGTGKLDPKKYIEAAMQRAVWCRRDDHDSGSIRAADGRRVFGNDTYLCSTCGMVKQFG